MFCDKVTFRIIAGRGGDGKMSFRHEKFREKGGPDGGDGGNGGSVFLVGEENLNTLYEYKTKRLIKAENGENGGSNRKKGASGEDLYLKVPVGTTVFDEQLGQEIADIDQPDKAVLIARGGEGGFGNAHFVSSVRQIPKVSEVGEEGEEKEIRLEMKLIADVGLIGKPNVGKSTLLSVLTSARPKIADYPFTTLVPNLGVLEGERFGLPGVGFVIADIPGLIDGAASGKGLGDEFLRHVERTKILVHLIDSFADDPVADFEEINRELKSFSSLLTTKKQIVVLSKAEGASDIESQRKRLEDHLKKVKNIRLVTKEPVIISSATHAGIKEIAVLLDAELRKIKSSKAKTKEEDGYKIFTIDDVKGDVFSVQREGDLFVITGKKIERFAKKTDFSSRGARERFFDISGRLGILKELGRRGAKKGDKIKIAGKITDL